MGYSVDVAWVHRAWVSDLGELDARLATMTRARVRRRGSEYLDQEDANSALVSPFAKKFATEIGLEFEAIIQPLIDIFGLTFNKHYPVEEELAESLMSAITEVLFRARIILDPIPLGKKDSTVVLSFLRSNVSVQEVRLTVSTVTEIQLLHAHRIWRAILRIVRLGFPEMYDAEDAPGRLKNWQLFAAGLE
jgi:hypothetical protein